MDMKTTSNGVRKFTREEKLRILKEAKHQGVKVTLEKYDLYPATYYFWKKKLLVYGEEGLQHASSKDREMKIRALEKENEQLKILLAERDLESKLKDELLKKRYPELKRKSL